MTEEILKDSPVFPDRYWVTNKGRIITKKTGLSRKFRKTWDGYYDVSLSRNGESRTIRVHRLVAKAFVDNPENLPVTNHIDGNKLNNDSINLEWTTVKGNTRHSYLNGLQTSIKGTKHGRSKFTKEQIVNVCELLDKKETHKNISKETGVSVRTIQSISAGVNWSHISKNYNFFKERQKQVHEKEDIVKVCELLDEGVSLPSVAKKTNVPLHVVQNIDRGHNWIDIAKNYKFYKIKHG